jgi:hypothetical protein
MTLALSTTEPVGYYAQCRDYFCKFTDSGR